MGFFMQLSNYFIPYLCTEDNAMKKAIIILFFLFAICLLTVDVAQAQCSICTRTASQLGEEPAKGLNGGIIYLAAVPYLAVGFVVYRWWKKNGSQDA